LNEYELGTSVKLDFTWKTDTDDDGMVDDPTDPTTVTFQVEKPDGTILAFTDPTPEISHPSVGRYVLSLGATDLDEPGDYDYLAIGTGDAEAVYEGTFRISGNALVTPVQPPQVTGVCGAWVDEDSLLTLCSGATWNDLMPYAFAASELLYYASGRRFPSGCEATVRPCTDDCRCSHQVLSRGHIVDDPREIADCWTASCCDTPMILLAGYPVRRVTEVMIDGLALDPGDYRLDKSRELVRIDGTRWPGCQDRALDNDEVGAFTVSYEYGADPPASGRLAALELAYQLWAACPGQGGDCQLPANVTQVTRQGLQYDLTLVANLLASGQTGVVSVDSFLAVFGTKNAVAAGAAVWSPDVPGFAQPVG
jgi:hypothetical protein